MMEPAYIAFDGKAGGEFAFGCVTGGIHCRKTPTGLDFTWEGNDEMDEASGDSWAELQKDGSLKGERRLFHSVRLPRQMAIPIVVFVKDCDAISKKKRR